MNSTGNFRFSLAKLLGAVVLVALGLAALVNATAWWGSLFLTSAILSVLVGVLGVCCRTGMRRAFWLGFSIFGGAYLVLAFAPWIADRTEPPLVTTRLLNMVYDEVHKDVDISDGTLVPDGTEVYWPRTPDGTVLGTFVKVPFLPYFKQVGHSLFTLLFAFLGGLIARYFYATRERAS